MVHITPIIAVALFSTLAAGLPSIPRPRQDDSAIGLEVAVSAPNGIPITNSVELASQSAREAGQTATAVQPVVTRVNYGGAYDQAKEKFQLSVSSPVYAVTTSVAAHVTTTSAHVVTTSAIRVHVTTSVAHTSAALPTHGSGSASWGNSAYQDCVQQCIAKFGAPPVSYKPTATNTPVVVGTGATHTVIVAPTQGVFRYIPFAVNATVGDTIKFMWGANNHTVTKSSALQPCNRTSDAVFASGVQQQDFVFTQVVNETSPTYFFCAVGVHCQRGMFGVVNPTTQFASVTSVAQNMQSLAANSSTLQGYAAYTAKNTAGNTRAARWGSNIDLSSFPDWAHATVAENVLYTRNFLASNPEVLKEDGSIDLSTADSTPLAIPQDIAAALASSTSTGTTVAAPSATSSSTPEESAVVNAGTASNLENGALSGAASPRMLVAAMAVLATYVLL